jgi:phosphate acetyltransferase
MSLLLYPHLDRYRSTTQGKYTGRVAVVYPCERTSLEAAAQVWQLGLSHVTLVGPRLRIQELADLADLDISGLALLETPDDPLAAAQAAVDLVRDGGATAIMKGSLHTDELLGVVVRRDSGLRGSRRLSHAFLFDIPGLDRPILVTDCVLNIAPDLAAKRDIAQNAIDLAHQLGISTPSVAVLSATESVNPSMQSSLDAAALSKMADRGQITGGMVDGPLGFDNAVSSDSASLKGIRSQVAGRPDILLVPSLDTGNVLYKCLVYMSKAACAGLVLGASVPIILTSRSDTCFSRTSSAALAAHIQTQNGDHR